MNKRNQLICAHSVWLYIAMTLVGFLLLPRWLPPPGPNLAQEDVVRIFTNNPMLRVGMEILMMSSGFFIPVSAAIATQMRRIEGPNHILSDLQLLVAGISVVPIQIASLSWLAISYRANTPPDIITVFNDLAWFMIIGAVSCPLIQSLSIGICILNDKSPNKIYPRWLGFWNIWLSLVYAPAMILPFVKTGPFAWNGVLGFWVVVNGFFIWMMLNYIWTVKAINAQDSRPAATSI
jgi:hypothetical protein